MRNKILNCFLTNLENNARDAINVFYDKYENIDMAEGYLQGYIESRTRNFINDNYKLINRKNLKNLIENSSKIQSNVFRSLIWKKTLKSI